MHDFTLELASKLYESAEQFPVDFDNAWQWLGYSTKGNGKRMLVENFEENLDFIIIDKPTTTGIQANPKQNIKLSNDCFRSLGMLAQTQKGKEVRKYYLEVEKRYKSQYQQSKMLPNKEAVQVARDIREILDTLQNQPRLSQILVDHAMSSIMEKSQAKLTGEKQLSEVKLRGVVEIAQDMGYTITHRNRTTLGKFVKKQCLDFMKLEERLVNGTMRNVCCYPDNEQVRKAITQFFS